MLLNSLVQGILQNPENLHHWLHVEDVESEDIAVGWKIEVPAVDDIPNCHVSAHSGSDELGQSAHAGIRVGVFETEGKVLGCIFLYWLQVLNLILVNKVPNNCIIKVEISQDFSI